MPDYRRYRVPGGTYFFTVNLSERRLDTLVLHIDLLREAVQMVRQRRPFHIDAWVILPAYLHASGPGRKAMPSLLRIKPNHERDTEADFGISR
jgi:REP element-mobilizing transposase RayT